MNLDLWTAVREYVTCEAQLAVLRHVRDEHQIAFDQQAALSDEIRAIETKATYFETYVREHL